VAVPLDEVFLYKMTKHVNDVIASVAEQPLSEFSVIERLT